MAKNDTPEIPGLFDDLPEEAPQEQIAKISLRSWRTHLASIRTLDRRIEKLIDEAVKQALAQGRKLTSADIGRVFQRHPELRAALDKTMQQLNDDLTATIEQGSKDAWLRANTAADAVVAAMANNNAQLAALLNAGNNKPQNDRALRAFQQREMQGLKLSDRVWRATEGMKLDMERAIEVALAEGVPAQKLSERVRELLKEPHRLYRRVRDKDGNLRLSQAAQKYHPGTGVYRSSYKNAMRVARTEVNMAYQASDSERWTNSWWVKGIRVSLSNNHTCLDNKGKPAPLFDICDLLAGDYPADFKFTGWHPQCRCYATAITCEYTDIRDYYRRKRAGEDMTGYTPPGTITEPPEQFKRWMTDNADRLAGAAQRGTTPYFVANNAKYTDPNWKPSKTSASADPMPAPRPKTPLEIADERHARRTAEEEQNIRDRWYKRQDAIYSIPTGLNETERANWIANMQEISRVTGVPIGKPMTYEQADKQSANPLWKPKEIYDTKKKKWIANPDYDEDKDAPNRINCQTCAPAYALRRRGFDIYAGGNTPGSQNQYLARGHWSECWLNPDGTPATFHSTQGWLDKQRGKKLTPAYYRRFFDEFCKEPGIYNFNMGWDGNQGHVTVIQRDADGTLRYIEPQHDNYGTWRDIDYLCKNLQKTIPDNQKSRRGIMRVDNKMFNPKFLGIFRH